MQPWGAICIAIATVLANPDLTGNETFGVMVNYGNYDGSSAIGITAMGVLGHDVLEAGDRVSLGGGVGFSDEGKVAGRMASNGRAKSVRTTASKARRGRLRCAFSQSACG